MDPTETQAAVDMAAEALEAWIEQRLGGSRPVAAITMGSGLGGLAARFESPLAVAYEELPGWPRPTVMGHAGRAVVGTLGGVPVLGLAGRVHLYEGGPASRVGFYVRVLGSLGVPALFLSNAAGTIREAWRPGELMLVADHIDLTGRSPLVGPVVGTETRFPDLSAAYDPELRTIVRETAAGQGTRLREGVYVAMGGPAYETPAEIRMLRTLGGDAVGMSTVPEVLVARALGIRCVAVSCLTNFAAGVTDRPLDHAEVLEVTEAVADDFQRLVAVAVARFPA